MSNSTKHELEDLEKSLKSAYVVLAWTLLPLSVLFNGLIITLVCVYHKLHDVPNKLTAGIACSDLLQVVIVNPLIALNSSGGEGTFKVNEHGCAWGLSLFIININFRSCLLQLLTLDRYLAVSRPLWYLSHVKHSDNTRKYCVVFISVYTLSTGAVPFVGEINLLNEESCDISKLTPSWLIYVFVSSVMALTLLVPTCLNICIYLEVRRRKTLDSKRESGDAIIKTYKTRPLLLTTIVYLSYIFFYPALAVSTFSRDLFDMSVKHRMVFGWTSTIFYMTAMPCVTPLLYILLKKEYQLAVDLLAMTPFWQWAYLSHDKLGSEYSTNYGLSRSTGSNKSERSTRCEMACGMTSLCASVQADAQVDDIDDISPKDYLPAVTKRDSSIPRPMFSGHTVNEEFPERRTVAFTNSTVDMLLRKSMVGQEDQQLEVSSKSWFSCCGLNPS